MAKLLIVSGSNKVSKVPAEPVSALLRIGGAFIDIINNNYDRRMDVDILILSPVYGLVCADEKIGFKKPIEGSWHHFVLADVMSDDEIAIQRRSNLLTLRSVFSKKHYDEVHVNVGYEMSKLIKGFEQIIPVETKITYDRGGLGQKRGQMREWLRSNSIDE
jgi:hypothetical protein